MDFELNDLIDKLRANEKVIELVKMMQPLEIIMVISKDFELQDEEAERVTQNLLQHVHNVHYEGMSSPGIETNKSYPVPSQIRKDNENLDEAENPFGGDRWEKLKLAHNTKDPEMLVKLAMDKIPDIQWAVAKNINTPNQVLNILVKSSYPLIKQAVLDNPSYKGLNEDYVNNLGALTPTVKAGEFPPDPREEPGDWPYDQMTTAAMDPHNKGRKRSLTQSNAKSGKVVQEKEKEPAIGKPNPFDPDPRRTKQVGGDEAGKGIYSRQAPHSRDNSTPTSGRSWSKQGNPGWSSSPPGKEWDIPPTNSSNLPKKVKPKTQAEDMNKDELPDALKPSPVGSPIPNMKFGGRSEPRRMGFRKR